MTNNQSNPASQNPLGSTTSSSAAAANQSFTDSRAPSEELIQTLISLGSGRSEAIAALQAAHNDPNLAFQILSGEINMDVTRDGSRSESNNFFEEFRSLPEWEQIRQQIAQNPQYLHVLIQEISDRYPEFVANINENLDDFLDLLRTPGGSGGSDDDHYGENEVGDIDLSQISDLGRTSDHGRQHTIYLTEEEIESVERLCDLGFDRSRVVEAFIACDKDEQVTANYLLNQSGED